MLYATNPLHQLKETKNSSDKFLKKRLKQVLWVRLLNKITTQHILLVKRAVLIAGFNSRRSTVPHHLDKTLITLIIKTKLQILVLSNQMSKQPPTNLNKGQPYTSSLLLRIQIKIKTTEIKMRQMLLLLLFNL